MKNIINKICIMLFAMMAIAFSSCVDPVDNVTSNVRTGGLVEPTKNIPYKLGATTTIDIGVSVPKGPGVATVDVYKQFIGMKEEVSNKVLYTTVQVSDNSSGAYEFSMSTDFADMVDGLTIDGTPIPVDENVYDIGAKFVFSYNSNMASGELILNGNTTNIIMANFFAGKYLVDHTYKGGLTADTPKELVPLSATECSSSLLPTYSNETIIRILALDNIEVEETSGGYGVMPPAAGDNSTYDEATGVLDIYYVLFGSHDWHEVYKPI